MQVFVFGRKRLVQRLGALLSNQGVAMSEVAGDDGLTDLPKPTASILAIVDSRAAGAEEVCRRINESERIPLVLLVERGDSEDWNKLDRLKVSGFILVSASDKELSARLSATIRRLAPLL